jgi:hypothetical protein
MKNERAFTRTELAASVAAVLLLALIATSAAINTKADSKRLICFNNLRLVGRGLMIWAGNHNQQFSWRTSVNDGGSYSGFGSPKPGNAWFEYLWQSNELVTPKILACPSDSAAKRASDWSQYISFSFRAFATSYGLDVDASIDAPRSWLSADRNMRADFSGGGCSTGINAVDSIVVYPYAYNLAWTNAMHGFFGHVLTTDGRVEFTSTARLREVVTGPGIDDGGSGVIHFLKAR